MLDLRNGCCLELLKTVPDNYFNLICADLPFGTTNCKWDSRIELPPLWAQLERVAKPDCPIILFAQTPFDKILGASNLPLLRYELIWEKTAATGHLNAKKMPMKAHENILVFYKKLPTYNPIMTHGHKRKTTKLVRHSSDIYGDQKGVTSYDSTSRYPRSVLKFSSDKQKNRLHPTQKPIALLKYIVETYSNEGDITGDFCMGSGTMGEAAIELNRSFVGFEKDKEIFQVAQNRICAI